MTITGRTLSVFLSYVSASSVLLKYSVGTIIHHTVLTVSTNMVGVVLMCTWCMVCWYIMTVLTWYYLGLT